MSSADNITARIISDAEKEAAAVLEAAQAKTEKFTADRQKETAGKVNAIEAEAKIKAADVAKKRESADALEQRKALLAARREKLDEAFARAETAIMESDGYAAFMGALLADCAENGGIVRVASADRQLADGAFLKATTKKVTRGDDDPSISGGFRLITRGGDMETDCSVASLVAAQRARLESAVCDILWGGAD